MADVVLLALTAVAAALIVWLLFFRQKSEYGRQLQQLQPKAKARAARPAELGSYTRAEVAKHSSPDDAWIVVQHKGTGEWRVYDITEYIDQHPGGDSILRNVGKDSTEGFRGPQHPATVFDLVEEYRIGNLVD